MKRRRMKRTISGNSNSPYTVTDIDVLLVLERVVQGLGGPPLRRAGVLEPVDDVGEVQRAAALARVEVVELLHEADHLLARGVLVLGEPLLQARDLVLGVEGRADARLAGRQDGPGQRRRSVEALGQTKSLPS